jgi:ribosomal protein S18 acetylase RimI-like enzyme
MRHFLTVDPGGCWVAADDARIVGFAISQNRGRVWFLATYGVLTGYQGAGIGRRLLHAALTHTPMGGPGLFQFQQWDSGSSGSL